MKLVNRGFIYASLAAVAYGLSLVIQKAGLNQGLSPIAFLVPVSIISGAIALPSLIKKRKQLQVANDKETSIIVGSALVGSVVAPVLLFYGQKMTNATNAGFISPLSSLFTVALAALILGERVSKKKLALGIPAILGAVLVSAGAPPAAAKLGDLLILICAVLWGLVNALVKIPMRSVDGGLIGEVRLAIAGTSFLVVGLVSGVTLVPLVTSKLIYILPVSFAFYFFVKSFYKAIDEAGPSIAALYLITYPVVTAVGAFLLLQENLTLLQLAGGAVVLISILKLSQSSSG